MKKKLVLCTQLPEKRKNRKSKNIVILQLPEN